MKKWIKSVISNIFPFKVKVVLFNSWYKTNNRFSLYAKSTSHYPIDLFQSRIIPSDFDLPLRFISKRFGEIRIYMISDFSPCSDILNKGIECIEIDNFKKLTDTPLVLFLAFESDEEMYNVWNEIKNMKNVFWYAPYRILPIARYFHRNKIAKRVLKEEYLKFRGKFDLPDFENIIRAIDITINVAGDYVEIGVYRGDSACVALNYMKEKGIVKKSYFLDLFEGFTNEASRNSGDACWADTHTDTDEKRVSSLLSSFDNAKVLKKDIIEDDLPVEIKQIAVCNIDVDIYEATLSAFNKVAPLIQLNGIIICEDQGHTPYLAGAYFAVQEFIKTDEGKKFVPIDMQSGQVFLIKTRM